MFKFANKLRHWRKGEEGASELVTTLFMLPLALFLILTLIDVSMYFNARSSVQNVTREGVRQAAMWGGTGGKEHVRLNPTSTPTATAIKNSLFDSESNKCKQAGCTKPPIVTCTTKTSTGNSNVAKNAGDTVTCTTTFYYKTVTPGSDYFGFAAAIGNEIKLTESALTETGYR